MATRPTETKRGKVRRQRSPSAPLDRSTVARAVWRMLEIATAFDRSPVVRGREGKAFRAIVDILNNSAREVAKRDTALAIVREIGLVYRDVRDGAETFEGARRRVQDVCEQWRANATEAELDALTVREPEKRDPASLRKYRRQLDAALRKRGLAQSPAELDALARLAVAILQAGGPVMAAQQWAGQIFADMAWRRISQLAKSGPASIFATSALGTNVDVIDVVKYARRIVDASAWDVLETRAVRP